MMNFIELLDEVLTVTGEDSIATARAIAIKEVSYVALSMLWSVMF